MTSTMKHVLLGIVILLPCSLTSPIRRTLVHHNEDTKKTTYFLDHYYPDDEKHHHSVKERLEMMQKFYHLVVTGILDDETKKVMNQPRCGVPDVSEYKATAGSPKWEKNTLTYRINNVTPDLPAATAVEEIEKGLQLWADVTPLEFIKTDKEPADIEIMFASRAHGDFNSFDGPGGTLAHAFFPGQGLGGDAHFDEDEKWSRYNRDVNLMLVAAHEFGHSLGLGHSENIDDLMYPTYNYKDPDNYKLPGGDTQRIQSLYGEKKDDGQDDDDYYC